MISVITIVKMLWTYRRSRVSPQQIFTNVMTNIIVDKSTEQI